MPYALSDHALTRIAERDLTPDDLAAALTGRQYRQANGNLLWRASSGRCAVVIDPRSQRVVTAYRLTRRQVKRSYSR